MFRDCELRAACLDWANLEGACLIGADLTGATLRQANLSGANLCGADCRWSDGEQLFLAGALYDGATILPPAFRPHEHGMIRRITAGRA